MRVDFLHLFQPKYHNILNTEVDMRIHLSSSKPDVKKDLQKYGSVIVLTKVLL